MSPEFYEQVRWTLVIVALAAAVLLSILVFRLWYLQVIKGHEFRYRSENNRIRTQDLPPWRGMILDRRGNILVNNRPAYDLFVVLEDIQDVNRLADGLGRLLKLSPEEIRKKIEAAQKDNSYRTVKVKGDLAWEELALVQTYKYELPGVLIQIQPKREYLPEALACHVIGYLGEITDNQLKSGKFPRSKMGDYVGKCGVELAWDQYLAGQRGARKIEVDAHGRELELISQMPSNPGANVTLTLDADLQRQAEAALVGKQGAVVALEPDTGRILALASAPTFDQNAFDRGVSAGYWKELVRHKDHPLENRVLKGQYPPGSTFKIVMAVAGLEEGVITPQTGIHCGGSFTLGNHVFRCWRKHGHGRMNLHAALVHSCDVYFYTVGRKLGIDRIAKWSSRFGLGKPSGLELDYEKAGLVATSAWKKRRFNVPWQEGDTISVSIGQGYNLTTPLQMARVTAAIANGGKVYVPQIVERVESPDGETVFKLQPRLASELQASPKTIELVRNALLGVVEDGTGRAAQLPDIEVAGKTGTAQVVALGKERKGTKSYDHAWFVCFAPVERSEIAVAVLIEHGGHGGSAAAPVARQVLESYFQQSRSMAQAAPGVHPPAPRWPGRTAGPPPAETPGLPN